MLKCHEVSRLAASEEIARAGFMRRMEFRLHLMMCRHCRNYVRQVGLLGAAARRLMGAAGDDARAVARLEAELVEAVRGRGDSGSGGHPHLPQEH
jgi:hypothetical protein